MQRAKIFKRLNVRACLAMGLVVGLAGAANAAMFVVEDPTTFFAADGLLLDEASTGGSDSPNNSNSFVTNKSLDVTTGAGPQDLTITGIGFALRNNNTSQSQESVTIEITYNGADGTFSTAGDNQLIGTATASLTPMSATGATVMSVKFDSPLQAQFDGLNDSFRFLVSSTGNIRVKTLSNEFNAKLSVGGTAVPEPASLALVGLGGLMLLRRR